MQPTDFSAKFFAQPLLGHGTSRHHGRRQCGPTIGHRHGRVTNAVFVPVGVVGMPWAEGLNSDVAVILAALVGDCESSKCNRCAGGLALVDTREDLDRIGLVALRHVARGAGATTIQVTLDVGFDTKPCPAGSRRSRSQWLGHATHQSW
jgi:hypothetical protein